MTQLDLMLEAPIQPRRPAEPILREAEIDGQYRWTLRRAWGSGPSILWCGLNPSTADGKVDDPTMRREIGFSFRWGFGSLVKVNLYPYRSSKPSEMRRWLASPESHGAYFKNARRVVGEVKKVDALVAAWGAGVDYEQVRDFMTLMFWDVDCPKPWKCLGTNADGSPIHTLARGKRRVPDDAKLVDYPFDFDGDYHSRTRGRRGR